MQEEPKERTIDDVWKDFGYKPMFVVVSVNPQTNEFHSWFTIYEEYAKQLEKHSYLKDQGFVHFATLHQYPS